VAATWQRWGSASRSSISRQAGTEAAPTLPDEGVDLGAVESLTIRVKAVSGQLDPGGQIDIYIYDAMLAGWCIAPSLVIPNPLDASSAAGVHFGTVTIVGGFGSVAPIAHGLSTQVDLFISCTRRHSGVQI
jgi:hypothetical protein